MRSQDRVRRTRTIKAIRTLMVASVLSVGCEVAPESSEEEASGDQVVPAVSPATSINAVMVGMVDHAAHHLWELGLDGMAPDTDQEWDEVIHHSIQLIASGTTITAGGTGVLDDGWVREPGWQGFAQDMTDAGLLALDAANLRDVDGVLRAGDALVVACEGCHTAYKPELPTEGMVHPHY